MDIGKQFRLFLKQNFDKYDNAPFPKNSRRRTSITGVLEPYEIQAAMVDFFGSCVGGCDDNVYDSQVFVVRDILVKNVKNMLASEVDTFGVYRNDLDSSKGDKALSKYFNTTRIANNVTFGLNTNTPNPLWNNAKNRPYRLAVVGDYVGAAADTKIPEVPHEEDVAGVALGVFPELDIVAYNDDYTPYRGTNRQNYWDQLLIDAKAGKIDAVNYSAVVSAEDNIGAGKQNDSKFCNPAVRQKRVDYIANLNEENKKAIETIRELVAMGIPVFVAAGNGPHEMNTLGLIDGVTTVSGTKKNGKLDNHLSQHDCITDVSVPHEYKVKRVKYNGKIGMDYNHDRKPEVLVDGVKLAKTRKIGGSSLASSAAAAAYLKGLAESQVPKTN